MRSCGQFKRNAPSILDIRLKITNQWLQPHLTGSKSYRPFYVLPHLQFPRALIQYRDVILPEKKISHWWYNTVVTVRLLYIHNGISYSGKEASLFWTNPLEDITLSCLWFRTNKYFGTWNLHTCIQTVYPVSLCFGLMRLYNQFLQDSCDKNTHILPGYWARSYDLFSINGMIYHVMNHCWPSAPTHMIHKWIILPCTA